MSCMRLISWRLYPIANFLYGKENSLCTARVKFSPSKGLSNLANSSQLMFTPSFSETTTSPRSASSIGSFDSRISSYLPC